MSLTFRCPFVDDGVFDCPYKGEGDICSDVTETETMITLGLSEGSFCEGAKLESKYHFPKLAELKNKNGWADLG